MYSGSADQTILKWDVETFEVVSTIAAHENPVCTLTVDIINNRLYSGSLKSIKVYFTYNSYISSIIYSILGVGYKQ